MRLLQGECPTYSLSLEVWLVVVVVVVVMVMVDRVLWPLVEVSTVADRGGRFRFQVSLCSQEYADILTVFPLYLAYLFPLCRAHCEPSSTV